jgi:hypothetical protein
MFVTCLLPTKAASVLVSYWSCDWFLRRQEHDIITEAVAKLNCRSCARQVSIADMRGLIDGLAAYISTSAGSHYKPSLTAKSVLNGFWQCIDTCYTILSVVYCLWQWFPNCGSRNVWVTQNGSRIFAEKVPFDWFLYEYYFKTNTNVLLYYLFVYKQILFGVFPYRIRKSRLISSRVY